ncbi:MAG: hypothetical protein KGL52_16305 [Rhodospirillales bacterium]|nr:hypothetical protein [Rhodospirillales bacterium]
MSFLVTTTSGEQVQSSGLVESGDGSLDPAQGVSGTGTLTVTSGCARS